MVLDQIKTKRLSMVAASVAFFSVLALFPCLSAAIAVYGLFGDREMLGRQLAALQSVLPSEVFGAVAGQAEKLLAEDRATLGLGLVAGIALAWWSLMRAALAIMTALNLSYDRERRVAYRGLVALGLAIGGFTVSVVSLILISLPTALEQSLAPTWMVLMGRAVRWPALALLVFTAISLLYHFGPNISRQRWRLLAPAPLLATAGAVVSTTCMSFLLTHSAGLGTIFGSLTGGVALLIWLYLNVLVLCIGGVLHNTISMTSPDPPRSSAETT